METSTQVIVRGGRTINIIYRPHADAHFVSLTHSARHGCIMAASVDAGRLRTAGADPLARMGAVEVSVLMGKKEASAATVVATHLALALAAAGDLRPLTLCMDLPDLESASADDRRGFVQELTAAVADIAVAHVGG